LGILKNERIFQFRLISNEMKKEMIFPK
jgi:hypothetical protein